MWRCGGDDGDKSRVFELNATASKITNSIERSITNRISSPVSPLYLLIPFSVNWMAQKGGKLRHAGHRLRHSQQDVRALHALAFHVDTETRPTLCRRE